METTEAQGRRRAHKIVHGAGRAALAAVAALTALALLAAVALVAALAVRVAPLERGDPRHKDARAWRQKDVRLGPWALGVRPGPRPARRLRRHMARAGNEPAAFLIVFPGPDGGGGPALIERPLLGGRLAWSRRLAPGERVVVTPGRRRDRQRAEAPNGVVGPSLISFGPDEVVLEFVGDQAVRVVRRGGVDRKPDGFEVFPGVEINARAGGPHLSMFPGFRTGRADRPYRP